MKTSVKYGFLFALLWIIINMVIFYGGISREAFLVLIMINLFFLLCAITIGLYMTKKERNWEVGVFLDDFKTSMQGGLVYAILIAGFIYLYHAKIDTSIRDGIINERIEVLHEAVPDSKTYKELQADDPTWRNKSFDDYIENQEDQIRSVVSPMSIFVMHLMGLSMLAFLYSFGSTIIVRKVVLRGMR
jgi:hypothetical protein